MKVTVLLKKDHELIKSLIAKLNKPSLRGNDRKSLFEELRREITIHSQMELEIFYPALLNSASDRAEELVSTAEKEHQEVERLLDELSGMSAVDKSFDTRLTTLIQSVEAHIEKEEEQILDEARQNLAEYRLEELGLEIEMRRRMLSTLAA